MKQVVDHVVEVSSVGFVFKVSSVVGVNRLVRPVVELLSRAKGHHPGAWCLHNSVIYLVPPEDIGNAAPNFNKALL